MAHPGSNITGFAGVGDIPAKRPELFTEVVPKLRHVLILIDPKDPTTPRFLSDTRATAKGYNLRLSEKNVVTEADAKRVFAGLKRTDADGIIALSPSLNTKFPPLMIRLAAEKHLQFAGYRKEWVEQGALFSYAHDLAAVGRWRRGIWIESSHAPTQAICRFKNRRRSGLSSIYRWQTNWVSPSRRMSQPELTK